MAKRLSSILIAITAFFLICIFKDGTNVSASQSDKKMDISIGFYKDNGASSDFSDYDDLIYFYVSDGSGVKQVSYSYTWSDGTTVNATTDSSGKIVLEHDASSVTSVKLSIDNIEPTDYIFVSGYDFRNFGYGFIRPGSTGNYSTLNAFPPAGEPNFYFQAGQTDYTSDIRLYEKTGIVTADITFEHWSDGTPMKLFSGDILTLDIAPISDSGSLMDCYYELETDTGYKRVSRISNDNGIYLSGDLTDVSKIHLTMYTDAPKVSFFGDLNYIGGLTVNGESDVRGIVTADAGDGTHFDVVVKEAELYEEGKMSFQCLDGSSSSHDIEMTMRFALQKNRQDIYDLDNFYWTLDSDPTVKHYADRKDYNGVNHNYIYEITIPLGDSITLHNMLPSIMWHEADAFSTMFFDGYSYKADNSTLILVDGKSSTTTTASDLGFLPTVFNVPYNGVDDSLQVEIQSSGPFRGFGYKASGYEMKFYIAHTSEQFIFSKSYDPNDNSTQPDKIHDFEVTLTDDAGNPYTGKVAYYICDGTDTVIDEDSDVQYAYPDSDGKFTIGLKAGQYVKIGRSLNDTVLNNNLRARQGWPDTALVTNASFFNNACFPELGMLPYGIRYDVKETGTDYSCQTIGSDNGVLDSNNGKAFYDLRTGHTLQEFIDLMKSSNLPVTVFVNTRNTGSLTIEKTLIGTSASSGDFSIDVEFRDDAAQFPSVLSYVTDNGTSGSVNVTDSGNGIYKVNLALRAGGSVTISGIPAGTTYNVTETSASSADYNVTYNNNSGSVSPAGTTVSITNTLKDQPTPSAQVTTTPTPSTTPVPSPLVSTGEDQGYYGVFASVSIVLAVFLLTVTGVSGKRRDYSDSPLEKK